MIKKILIVCLLLLGIHTLVIHQHEEMGYATHQMQSNVIRTQQYLYGKYDMAVVGTSLSARLLQDSLPETLCNLSFGGCTVEDGLNLILSKAGKPAIIFVETNFLTKESTSDFIAKNTEPASMTLRKYLPVLREQYQPICLIADLLLHSTGVNPQAGAARVDTVFLHRQIETKLATEEKIDEAFEQQRIQTVKEKLLQLQQLGCKLVFFEMPIHNRLKNYPTYAHTRQLVHTHFPASDYTYMDEDPSDYLTTDGIHLDYEGQKRFSAYFNQQLTAFREKTATNQ